MAIDDVIKPDDANSPTERDKINNRFSNTLLSRLATETTPLAIIMQRLHADDLCGYLMKGGTSDTYEWLNIPGIITPETGSQEWYDKQIEEFGYTNVTPITYSLPESENRTYEMKEFEGKLQPISSFWSVRKTVDTLLGLCEKDPQPDSAHSPKMAISPRAHAFVSRATAPATSPKPTAAPPKITTALP